MKLQFFLFRLFLRDLRLTARLRRVLEFLFLFLFLLLGAGEDGLEEGGEIYPYRLLNSEVFSLYKEPQACWN